MPYALIDDIYIIFGQSNVEKWADLNNNESIEEIQARATWALAVAGSTIDAALRGGRMDPDAFEAPYDPLIIDANARLAGVLLYENRGIADTEDGTSLLAGHRKMVELFLRNLSAGVIKITVAPTRQHAPTPLKNSSYDYKQRSRRRPNSSRSWNYPGTGD